MAAGEYTTNMQQLTWPAIQEENPTHFINK